MVKDTNRAAIGRAKIGISPVPQMGDWANEPPHYLPEESQLQVGKRDEIACSQPGTTYPASPERFAMWRMANAVTRHAHSNRHYNKQANREVLDRPRLSGNGRGQLASYLAG
jgi:hypothetical protein